MKLTKLKNLVSYFGPYPYNPTLIFLFFGSLYFSRYVPIVLKEPADASIQLNLNAHLCNACNFGI